MRIRFAHLSDFHLKGRDDPVAAFNQDTVIRSMAESMEKLVEECITRIFSKT